MEEEIKKLREAGFTDADIQTFVNDQKSRAGQPSAVDPAQVDTSQPAVADEKVPAYGAPPDTSALETVATGAAALAPYALPAALGAAGLGTGVGLYKFGSKALDVGRDVGKQMAQSNAIEAARAARLSNRPGFGGVPQAAPAPSAGPQIVNASGQPMRPVAGPVAPAVAPPAPAMAAPAPTAAQPNMMQRGMDYASKMREVAAQRVLPVMGQAGQMAGRGLAAVANSPVTRLGGMAANAMYSGDLNANEAAELERRRKMAPTITR